jgi:hypothetical protein
MPRELPREMIELIQSDIEEKQKAVESIGQKDWCHVSATLQSGHEEFDMEESN